MKEWGGTNSLDGYVQFPAVMVYFQGYFGGSFLAVSMEIAAMFGFC